MNVKNSRGKVYYGMHFYPGVAEYSEEGKDPFRIFVNEATIRKMNPSFAARPVFVEHVDEVEENKDELRKEADGWVVESFFNAADGKHWVKFIVVTDRAERAIAKGYRLSNAYFPQSYGKGGHWNGVTYEKEVTSGEFEHLAIVQNPRYEESVVMTPEQFKAYCEEQNQELLRLANSKENKKENETMKISFFKKQKVDNSADLEGMSVTLPKTGKEKTITQLVNEADEYASRNGLANVSDKVKVGEEEMSVEELVKKYGALCSELEELKKSNEGSKEDDESVDNEDEESEDESVDNEDEESVDNKDEGADEDLKLVEKDEEKVLEKKKNAKVVKDKKHFNALKNAHKKTSQPIVVDLMEDQIARGQSRYGSN